MKTVEQLATEVKAATLKFNDAMDFSNKDMSAITTTGAALRIVTLEYCAALKIQRARLAA